MKKAVILVSGGMDSATVCAIAASEKFAIYALSFDYQQRHRAELKQASKLLQAYNIKQHHIVNIDLRSFGGSALTDDNIDVPLYKDVSAITDTIPATYVPARNIIFLSYALGFAEIIGSYDIFIGANATDYNNYPDCRSEFIHSFENVANIATAAGVTGKHFKIHAPLIHMTKSDIIAKGLELGVNYVNTMSCYNPSTEGISCGQCQSCVLRLKAFADNGIRDPIAYANKQ